MKIDSFYGGTILLSEKSDGNMRIGKGVGEDNSIIADRQRKFLLNNKVNLQLLCVASVVHGNDVVVENSLFENPKQSPDWVFVEGADALCTNKRGICLAVGYADCPTVFVVDPKHWAVGIAHCGWRGLASGVIGNLLAKMRVQYDSRPETMFAYVGPGIEREHYEVGQDVLSKFHVIDRLISSQDKAFIDLRDIIQKQLAQNGLRWIQFTVECTHCELNAAGDDKYFSGRRDAKPIDQLETNMAFIVIQ